MFKNKWKKKFEEEASYAHMLKVRNEQIHKDLEDAYYEINRLRNELHELNKVRFTGTGADYPRRESATSASNRKDYLNQSQVVRDVQADNQIKYDPAYFTKFPRKGDKGSSPYTWRI